MPVKRITRSPIQRVMRSPLDGSNSKRKLSFNVTLAAAGSYTLGLSVHPGKTSIINWGDGTSTTVTYSAGDYQDQVHSYSAAGTYTIIVTNSESIKGIRHTSTTNGNIWFDLSSIPNATYVSITGSNTVSGNLSSIPKATYVSITGSNTVSGNLSSIPKATYVNIWGSNTVSGNLSSIPNATLVYVAGANTISGNLSSIPNVTTVNIWGSNTISGNLSSIPNATTVAIGGSNTVSGNLSSIPNATTVAIAGSNTVSGNLSSIPNATYIYVAGANTISGNLSSIPNAKYVDIAGSNTVSDYTLGTLWTTSISKIIMRQATGYGFSSAEVDNLLIDLAARVTTWTSEKTVDLRGANAARTAASDAAVATITSRGAVVYTN